MPRFSRSRNINLAPFNAQLVDGCSDNFNSTESTPLNPEAEDREPAQSKSNGNSIREVPARPAVNGQGHTNQLPMTGPESNQRLLDLPDPETTNGQGSPTGFPVMGPESLRLPPELMRMATAKREELLRRLPLINGGHLHQPSELKEVLPVLHTENDGRANESHNANGEAKVQGSFNEEYIQNLLFIAETCNDTLKIISSMESQFTDLARVTKSILDNIPQKELREWLAKTHKDKETHVLDRENIEDLTEQPCLQPTKLASHISSCGEETPRSLSSASTNGGDDRHGLRDLDFLQYSNEESKGSEDQVTISSFDNGVCLAGRTSLEIIKKTNVASSDDTDTGLKTPPESVAGLSFLDFLPRSPDKIQPHSLVSSINADESQSSDPAISIGQVQSPILAVTQTAPRAIMPRGSFKLDIIDEESDSSSGSDSDNGLKENEPEDGGLKDDGLNDDGLLTPIARYINNRNQAQVHAQTQVQTQAQTRFHPITPTGDIGEISFGECTREEYITTGYFTFNVIYNPSPQVPQEALSRRVTISNLPKGIDISEVLGRVRGGPIEWTSLVDTTFCGTGMTVFVSFIAGIDAKRFVDYASEAKLEFHGSRAVVRLTPTPSYPLNNLTALRLREVQESRSLRITYLEEEDMDTIVEELCGTEIPSHHVESTVQAGEEMLINFTSIISARAVHYRVWHGDYLFESEHVPDPCIRQDDNQL